MTVSQCSISKKCIHTNIEYGDIYRENMDARLKEDESSGNDLEGKHKMKKVMQNNADC